jgi:hypothetical protein
MEKQRLAKLEGFNWSGKGELWLDPEGNKADLFDCQLQIDIDSINYTWIYEGETKNGSFKFNDGGVTWIDTWHQPESVECKNISDSWGIFTVKHSYEVPSSPSWGWQSKLTERPDGTLVLQMTNVAPWGEGGRAVRMIFSRVKS